MVQSYMDWEDELLREEWKKETCSLSNLQEHIMTNTLMNVRYMHDLTMPNVL